MNTPIELTYEYKLQTILIDLLKRCYYCSEDAIFKEEFFPIYNEYKKTKKIKLNAFQKDVINKRYYNLMK